MITVDAVVSWEPCPRYTRERVVELFAGRDVLTPQEVAVLDIPPQDIVWTLLAWLQACGHEMIIHNLACSFAERALMRERKASREPHTVSWDAIEIKRKWLRGESTDEQLDAARDAAEDAAEDVAHLAGSAAHHAAWAAARAAARDAVDAARAAAQNVAWAAARDAAHLAGAPAWNDARNVAWVVEARHQITMILEVMP